MYKLKTQLIFPIYILIIFYFKTNKSKDIVCYMPKVLEYSWTDRRPDFKVNLTFTNRGFMRSLNWIERDIQKPIAQLEILQTDCGLKTTALYNLTARLCDIQKYIKMVPMFMKSIQNALKQGNYTYECPLKRGFYVMANIRVASRDPILSFMYRANRTFTFIGGLYEELKKKSVIPLSTYRFKGQIMKKLCKD